VVTLKTKSGAAQSTAMRFGTAPAASFGNTQGSSTPGLTVETTGTK
jgi:hypothetical protein